jgi:hypothetical protein
MLQHSGSTSIITLFYINFSIKVLKLPRRQNSMKLSGADIDVSGTPSQSSGCADGLVAPVTDD